MTWGMEWGTPWGEAYADYDMPGRIAPREWTVLLRSTQSVGLLAWIAEQFQEADNVANDTIRFARLANAFGEQLNRWGSAFGLPRLGLDDVRYRQAIILRAASLFRKRSVEVILELIRILTDGTSSSAVYRDYYPASYEVELYDVDAETADHWERILRYVKPEGVRFTAKVVEDSTDSFRFDTAGRGFDQGRQFAYTLESQ